MQSFWASITNVSAYKSHSHSAPVSTAMHCGCPTGQRARASTIYGLHLADWLRGWWTWRQAPWIRWWFAVICRDDWQRLSVPALTLHQLSSALVSAQSPATQWKQVRRHHHWDSSTSRSGAAADTSAKRPYFHFRSKIWRHLDQDFL